MDGWMDGKVDGLGNYALLSSFCRRKIILYYLHEHAFAIYSNRKIIWKFIPYDQHHPVFLSQTPPSVLLGLVYQFAARMVLVIVNQVNILNQDLEMFL